MMKPILFFILIISLQTNSILGQMQINDETKYGNEWIDFDQNYFKIKIAQDGIYQISYDKLLEAGVPIDQVKGSELQLFFRGEQVPLELSNQGILSSSDYINFYGQQNDGFLDQFIINNGAEGQLNPEYSMFNDTSAYFLTWKLESENPRLNVEENQLNNSLEPLAFYMHNEKLVFTDFHYKPTFNGGDKIRWSSINQSEGYGKNLTKESNVAINPTSVYSAGPTATLKVRFGSNDGRHLMGFEVNGEDVYQEEFDGNLVRTFTHDLEAGSLGNTVNARIKGLRFNEERNIISVAELNYPRIFDFGNSSYFEFNIDPSTTQTRLDIENFQADEAILYDLSNEVFFTAKKENDIFQIVLPASSVGRNLVLIASAEIKEVGDLVSTSFEDYSLLDPEYIILTSKKLNVGDENPVKNYAEYRSSNAGGAYEVVIVDSEDLYDQFGYGVERHTLGINNFSQYIRRVWERAQYSFIIGKAYEYPLARTTDNLARVYDNFMIPTFGQPGSDNLMLSEHGSFVPFVPTGRLAATNSDHVENYLNKVKNHQNPIADQQTIADQLWKKRVIHLKGGDAAIGPYISRSLDSMERVLSKNLYGAEVKSFEKTSSDVIQTTVSDQIFNAINEGVSFITFFGHSAVGTLDFSIEDLSKFDNANQLPIFVALGCNSGNVHSTTFGVSEEFILEPEKGSVVFFASSSSAYASQEFSFGRDIYDLMGNEFYGKSLGFVIHQILKDRNLFPDISIRTLGEQMTFHGDPAIKLHPKVGPDFIVDYGSIATEPSIIGTNNEKFELNFDVVNLGFSVTDSITLLITHEIPSGEIIDSIYHTIAAPIFKTSHTVEFDIPGITARGKNKINITVDFNDKVVEHPLPAADINNKTISPEGDEGYCFFIIDNNLKPVSPREFAIVNDSNFELNASTSNALAAEQKYVFQIDTTLNFDSPLFVNHEVTQRGGLVSWKPEITPVANTVYYWRVHSEPLEGQDILWTNSSFVYMPDEKSGWNQSHFYQYLEGESETLVVNEESRGFEFSKSLNDIKIKNQFYDFEDFWYFVNSTPFASLNPQAIRPLVGITIWDPYTFWFVNETRSDYGSIPHAPSMFGYKMDKIEDRKGIKELLDAAPEGDRITFMTYLDDENTDFHTEEWAADSLVLGYNLFSVLEGYGAKKVRLLEERGTVPYTLIFDKGGEVIEEIIGEDIYDFHQASTVTEYFDDNGEFNSTLIGPALKWDKVFWSEKKEGEDISNLQIIGVDLDGNEEVLLDEITTFEVDISFINVDQYPFIKLKYAAQDEDRTAPQLNFWRVLFDELPDAALDLKETFTFVKDTIQQGQDLVLNMGLTNVSLVDMDSILVNYAIKDASNNVELISKRFAPLNAEEGYALDFGRKSTDLSGDYELTVLVNPNEDQKEQNLFNNFALTRFHVAKDSKNPLLDVTFDGVHILNGDIVSSQPNIVVFLQDENPFLKLDSEEDFDLSLVYPDGEVWIIPQGHESVTFYPATDDKNQARIEFNPLLDQEGEYKFFANARDASGNVSGEFAYEINFQVILAQKVSNVINYPNPFSSSTQFVFTVTGQVPQSMYIQVMTLSGKVVKEITQDQLGPIKVGINRTSYKWNGTDEYGNQLANGVYLYRAVINDGDNQAIELHETGIDSYFKEGFGKLVILR